jgi:uracil-DNA glycosylase family 4
MIHAAKLEKLNAEIIRCKKCPRLVKYRKTIGKNPPLRYRGQRYWARPLPGFGDPNASIHIVGLAPAANGGNRTGRIFTGDRSGDWLFGTLFAVGLANQETSISKEDGLQTYHAYIGAAVRCAPPDNKPTIQEFENCRPYLNRELQWLPNVKVIVVLGSLAYNAMKKILRSNSVPRTFRFPPFGHGRKVELPDGKIIICSYHPSQQNTFTGKLTREMFRKIFEDAKKAAGVK